MRLNRWFSATLTLVSFATSSQSSVFGQVSSTYQSQVTRQFAPASQFVTEVTVDVIKSNIPFSSLLYPAAVPAPTAYTYNGGAAATYAATNFDTTKTPYGTANPFPNYYSISGGNCTNFASQCIMAGLVSSYKPAVVFQSRGQFIADKGSALSWYFISDADRAKPAWAGADGLFKYAKGNTAAYKGLHFVPVTDITKVVAGDIVFGDWDGNGTAEHSMIATSFYNVTGLNRIRVTYQNGSPYPNLTDQGLGDVMAKYPSGRYYIYRPVGYSTVGQ